MIAYQFLHIIVFIATAILFLSVLLQVATMRKYWDGLYSLVIDWGRFWMVLFIKLALMCSGIYYTLLWNFK